MLQRYLSSPPQMRLIHIHFFLLADICYFEKMMMTCVEMIKHGDSPCIQHSTAHLLGGLNIHGKSGIRLLGGGVPRRILALISDGPIHIHDRVLYKQSFRTSQSPLLIPVTRSRRLVPLDAAKKGEVERPGGARLGTPTREASRYNCGI